MDVDHAIAAAEGARVVFHCASRPYQHWKDELPRMNTGILAAARAAGARLVVADNLYMYAQTPLPIT
ncbi:MAG: NAD-dependent epimerase, partial [Thermaurantiacus sp.]